MAPEPGGPAALPVHGGLDPAELRSLGVAPEAVLDFSASVNPLGLPPGVRRAIAATDLSAYPDRACLALREALAARERVTPDHILVGNGSTQLIHLIARAWLRPGDETVLFTPTFGEYQAACDRAGAAVRHVDADEREGFAWDLDAAVRVIDRRRPVLTFVCDPNNPTGVRLGVAAARRIAGATGKGLLIVDEAYKNLADEPQDGRALLDLPNVVLLRSMTKDYALAGLRLGYLLASPEIVRRIAWFQPAWSVSGVAQAAGLAALQGGDSYLGDAREAIRSGKDLLHRELTALGLRVLPSCANFLIVEVDDATGLRQALLIRGVAVRDCTSFGLPRFIRIGIRGPEDGGRLVNELKAVLGRG